MPGAATEVRADLAAGNMTGSRLDTVFLVCAVGGGRAGHHARQISREGLQFKVGLSTRRNSRLPLHLDVSVRRSREFGRQLLAHLCLSEPKNLSSNAGASMSARLRNFFLQG